jgi:hypothetical protein
MAWLQAFRLRSFRIKMILFPALFIIYSAITQRLGNYVETRTGILLHDKLLDYIPQYDFSLSIFLLLYGSICLLIITHLNKPTLILRLIEMHFYVAIVRQICILMLPLEPPIGIIVLRDLFLENTVYPRNSPLTKDLFFSGHVASIWIYYLVAQLKWVKTYMILATIWMSFMILSMRVHYTIDVFGAILFTTVIYFAPIWLKCYFYSQEEKILN